MKKKKYKNWIHILVLTLVISVGYAALASNLKINGTTGIKNATWNIHWASPTVDSGSVTQTKPTLSENNTNATYSVTLNKPGDYYEFTIDAVNEGTLDAQILKIDSRFDGPEGTPIVTEGENRNLPAYLEYEVTYADENHTPIAVNDSLNHGQTKKYRVRVVYSENINPEDLEETDTTTKFYFGVEYKQKEKNIDENDENTEENYYPELINYTMDEMCPGCVYSTYGNAVGHYIDITGKTPNTLDDVVAVSNYRDLNSNYFLGHIIKDGVIKRIFVCGIENNQPFCLSSDNGLRGEETFHYQRNKQIMNHFFNTCYEVDHLNKTTNPYKTYRCTDDNPLNVHIKYYGNENWYDTYDSRLLVEVMRDSSTYSCKLNIDGGGHCNFIYQE